ncbi:alpha/beta hydrolase [Saccharopolyspora sp. SCSIO 74807]|uniref:alpha/beta fold hydrolase n=1 Tax=Saccharopolyspora sp. SCSIO 74807 TaxID=3118084 RepID=UPI0030CD1125
MTRGEINALEPTMLPLGEVNLVDRGAGPALLLLHGNGRTWQDWRPQFQTLTDRLRLIAYDQRGFGQSTLNEDLLSLVQLADDAAEVLNQLGVEHAYVAGISMGAQVAQILARRYPHRVDGIILGGSPYLAEDFEPPQDNEAIADLESMSDEQLLDYVEVSLSRLKQGSSTSEAERNALFEQFKEMRGDPIVKRLSQRRFCPEDLTILQEYEKVKAPALILHGEADTLPAEGATRMSERIPTAQLVVIPGGQHISNMEPTSALFDEAVASFVATRP